MSFDFLPKLPSANLDDRSFDDLVNECTLRIPRYCPEWTDHNLSDPGITLIELFAWLTDQMLLRFNQVPKKNYVAFLELLGIRLHPPRPAQTELAFYLASDLEDIYTIPSGIEVATVRTEQQEAIIFSTDRSLQIGKPALRHILKSRTTEVIPQRLEDPIINEWTPNETRWQGPEKPLFDEHPEIGNVFYLVLDPDTPLDGNILAISFQGAAATPTGIDPEQPPRVWEAWDGESWQNILFAETDDETKGFSFHELNQQGQNPAQGVEIRLHLPLHWPETSFTAYRGRWLRCRVIESRRSPRSYTSPPRVTGIGIRSIGGTVLASQSTAILNERLGISDGNPGQTFQLLGTPLLERRDTEYILIEPINGLPQRWEEVHDFSESTPQSRHYTVDSLTGVVQFGPLIREPNTLRHQTQMRAKVQDFGQERRPIRNPPTQTGGIEHQYGAIPPVGSVIKMAGYRTGGGRQGNVRSHTLTRLRSAVPYVERVTNHTPAQNGADGESLEQAVLRAPKLLRTRNRAVTAEDFETLTRETGAVARVRCLSPVERSEAGIVRLLVVPQANTDPIEQGQGLAPDQLVLNHALRSQVLNYLDERRLLGIQVHLDQPTYVGVSIQAQISLNPIYNNPQAQAEILSKIQVRLYQYLNPLTGGVEGNGWPFGRPVYQSDIIALLQQTTEVRYIGRVSLYALRQEQNRWIRARSDSGFIDPGPLGLICSWANQDLRSGHIVNILREA